MPPGTLAASAGLGVTLALLSAIDWKTFRLPDIITLPLILAGLALSWLLDWQPAFYWRAGAAVAGYLLVRLIDAIYHRLRGRTGIGEGDAKLLAAAGAWVGPEGLPGTLLYACAGALIFTLLRALTGHETSGTLKIPFGPFLAGGLWLVWIYGPLVW